MEFYKILFDKNNELTILEQVEGWPSTDIHYHVNLKMPKGIDVELKYIHHSLVDIALKLRELFNQQQIDILYPLIEKYGDAQYNDAAQNAAMDAAGEDI